MTRKVATLVRNGMPPSAAGERVGISRATLNEWIRRGEERDDRPSTSAYATFAIEIRSAEADFMASLIASVSEAALGGDWRASLALLERRFPGEFSPRRTQPPEKTDTGTGITLKGLAALISVDEDTGGQ